MDHDPTFLWQMKIAIFFLSCSLSNFSLPFGSVSKRVLVHSYKTTCFDLHENENDTIVNTIFFIKRLVLTQKN